MIMKTLICLFAVVYNTAALPSLNWTYIKGADAFVEPLPTALNATGPRVIGGFEAARNSIPYQVALIINGASFCGGSLIARNWVLTAAHCTIRTSYIQVILGAHNVRLAEATQIVLTSTSVINHALYNAQTLRNDIALVRLPSAVTLSSVVQLITLAPAASGTFVGNIALLSGWGRTTDASNAISPVLRRVNLQIITNALCQSTFGTMVQASNICTSGAGIVGACNGDSGGPLVTNGVQVGVVSFGSNRCQAGNPTAFARVSAYRSWIAANSGV